VESGALSLYGFWQWLSYIPMARVQGKLLGGGGQSATQLAASPAVTAYTPSFFRPPTLGDKASRERWPWQYASASHQLSAGKLRVIASALYSLLISAPSVI
jgi:hypothetical protein